jgi:hypothetical protein
VTPEQGGQHLTSLPRAQAPQGRRGRRGSGHVGAPGRRWWCQDENGGASLLESCDTAGAGAPTRGFTAPLSVAGQSLDRRGVQAGRDRDVGHERLRRRGGTATNWVGVPARRDRRAHDGRRSAAGAHRRRANDGKQRAARLHSAMPASDSAANWTCPRATTTPGRARTRAACSPGCVRRRGRHDLLRHGRLVGRLLLRDPECERPDTTTRSVHGGYCEYRHMDFQLRDGRRYERLVRSLRTHLRPRPPTAHPQCLPRPQPSHVPCSARGSVGLAFVRSPRRCPRTPPVSRECSSCAVGRRCNVPSSSRRSSP